MVEQLAEHREKMNSSLEKIHQLLWNESGLDPNDAMEHMYMFIGLRIIEPQVDKLELPEICKWSVLKNDVANEHILDTNIKNAVNALRRNAKTKRFFEPHKLDTAEKVQQLFREINAIDYETLSSTDVLGDLHEYMMGRGMSIMADEGQYFTPRAICRLATRVCLDIKNQTHRADGTVCTFADLFCGTGGFTLEWTRQIAEKARMGGHPIDWSVSKSSIYSVDKSLTSIRTTILNFLVHTGELCEPSHVSSHNTFQEQIVTGDNAIMKDVTFDYVLENPPFGGDGGKGEQYRFKYFTKGAGKKAAKHYRVNDDILKIGIEENSKVSAAIQLTMATLSPDGGIAAMVLPQGVMFSVSPATMVELRRRITEEYRIHYVVDVPAKTFSNTGTKTSIIIFQRGVGPTETVKFIVHTEKVLAEASIEQIREKHYSLSFSAYVAQAEFAGEGFNLARLGDIVHKLNMKHYKTASMGNVGKYPLISSSLNVEYFMDTYTCDVPSLIVNTINAVGNCTIHYYDKFSTTSNTIVLTANENYDTRYIYYYLKRNTFLVSRCFEGTTKMKLSTDQLLNIQIPLPSFEKQKEIAELISGWDDLARGEESQLKILERCAIFDVRELGRGKPTVRLGDVCTYQRGKALSKKEMVTGNVPVIGGGTKPTGHHDKSNCPEYTTLISQSGTAGHISRYTEPVYISDCFGIQSSQHDDDMLYYLLLGMQKEIKDLGSGTVQQHVYPSTIEHLMIHTFDDKTKAFLRPMLDEIRHKFKMLEYYRSRAKEAIDRLIPKIEQTLTGKDEARPSEEFDDEAGPSGDTPEENDGPEEGGASEKDNVPEENGAPEDDTPQSSKKDQNYEEMTVQALRGLCKERGIRGYSKLKKTELVKLLAEEQ